MRENFRVPKGEEILHLITHHPYTWLAAIVIVILDQVAKNLVLTHLNPQESIPLIQGILHLTFVQNTGIAFGLFQDANIVFAILSTAIIIVIVAYLPKVKANEHMVQLSLGLLLGGACGNLIDRLFLGYVVDFMDLRVWPVFNIADMAISISVVLLLFLLWRK